MNYNDLLKWKTNEQIIYLFNSDYIKHEQYNIYAVQETTVTNSGTIGKVDCRN